MTKAPVQLRNLGLTALQSHLKPAGGFSWQLLLTVSLYQLLKTGTLYTRVQHSF